MLTSLDSPFSLPFCIILFIHFWLCWVFAAGWAFLQLWSAMATVLQLWSARATVQLQCTGFSYEESLYLARCEANQDKPASALSVIEEEGGQGRARERVEMLAEGGRASFPASDSCTLQPSLPSSC